MAVYQRQTRVAAPLSTVWDFHSRVSGLEALTPGFMHLTVEAVRGPGGDPDPEVLDVGAEIDMAMRPLNLGSPQRWTSVITDRRTGDGTAMFRDAMEGGPFREWVHTHSFYADGDETVLRDRVEYRLPFGGLGDAVGPFARLGFEPMFRFRHRKTKELLE